LQTHTVSPPRWKSIFDSFSRVYDGSSATLEVLDPERGAQREVEEQPFRGISYDSEGITLHFAPRGAPHLAHIVAHPTAVLFEEGDDGFVAAMEIEASDEPPIILHLHAPVPSRLLTESKE
jgi:hypothetical protein